MRSAPASIPTPPVRPSDWGRLFADVPLGPSARPRALPRSTEVVPATVPWRGGRAVRLENVLAETRTRAFVVLHRGRLVREWYDATTTPTTRLSSWSVAKSMVALVAAQAIDEGRLRLDSRVVDVLPELRVTGPRDGDRSYNQVTVRDLMDMTSGIDAPESYSGDPTDPASLLGILRGTYVLMATPDLGGFARSHRTMVARPGSRGEYISFNTQLLSMVVARALGTDFVSAFRERLWKPARAQSRATWNLDRAAGAGGIAKGFCCLNATARDFARLGLLIEDAGTDASPVTRRWAERIFTPRRHRVSDWPYSTSFWHEPGGAPGRPSQDASAIGIFGQYIYVNRRTDTVIVKLSDYGIEQDEALTLRAMRSIANSWRRG